MLEKKATDIKYADVKAFCDAKHPENAWLDYKQTFDTKSGNAQIAKIVSAMANAHGGWILLGVVEGTRDSLGRGLPGELVGVPIDLGLPERIKQICLDAIYPPVVPEIGVCTVPTNANTHEQAREIIIVRVFESQNPPHQTSQGKVYIRTSDISFLAEDGKEAFVSEIEMLLDRRRKPLEKKEQLLHRSRSRIKFNSRFPQLTMYCIPTYPAEPICDFAVLTQAAMHNRKLLIFQESNELRFAHESILDHFTRRTQYEGKDNLTAYELNIYGVTALNTTLSFNPYQGKDVIDPKICMSLLSATLRAAELFFKLADFSGLVDVGMELDGSATGGSLELPKISPLTTAPIEIVDKFIPIRRSVLSHQISSKELYSDICTEFLWSVGAGSFNMAFKFAEQWYQDMALAENLLLDTSVS